MSGDVIAIFGDGTLEEMAAVLSGVAGVMLNARESTYWGDPYYSGWPDTELKLTLNRDPMYRPGDPPEEEFFIADVPDARFVLWEANHEDEHLRADGVEARIVSPPSD